MVTKVYKPLKFYCGLKMSLRFPCLSASSQNLLILQALIHGLNRHYYSIAINYRKNELEQKMLLNLHKKSWVDGLTLEDYSKHCSTNENTVKEMLELAKNYHKVSQMFLFIYLTHIVVVFHIRWMF